MDSLERRQLFAAILSDVGTQPTGALAGKIVYANAGHGFTYGATTKLWNTGRGLTNGIVEDMGTQDQLTYYADELFRLGATVVPMRPVGHQTNEVIVDNVNATYTGAWTDTTNTTTPYFSTSNGSGVHYRYASTSSTETAVAKYTPTLTAAGYYPVYAWAPDGTDRSVDQVYRVNHAGGATEVKVNHQRVGKGWVYLGTYKFNAGTAGSVEVSNRSGTSQSGKVVIADAIRFGNGMGNVVRNGTTSGVSQEDEASLYWVEGSAGWTAAGVRVSSTNWRTSTTSADVDANVGAPIRWARYMNNAPFGQSVYLSFHSNASGGTGTQVPRGTEGLYNDTTLFPGTATTNQKAWATLVGTEITQDLVSVGSPPLEYAWSNNANPIYARSDYAFGEIRGDTNGNEFDATIAEVAYHDSAVDAALLKAPLVRQKVALASAQATVKYFAAYGGGTAVFAPDAPTNVSAVGNGGNGNVVVSWKAPATSATLGGPPTGYRVYASRDGYSFDGGQYVAGAGATSLKLFSKALGVQPVYFKVVAVNAGGESPASGVVSARPGDRSYGRVLIVNGFDRLDRTQDDVDQLAINGTSAAAPGTPVGVTRVRPRAGNSFDYSVQYAQAIASGSYALGFDTADNEAVVAGGVNLASYNAVIWISGEESTVDKTFSAAEQTLVKNYIANGGKFMASGSEIGYDLVGQGNGATFFNSTLHSGYTSDDAGTYAATGAGLFAGLSLSFDDGTGSTYNVDYPDRLAATNGSTSVLNYSGGTGGVAATAYSAGAANTKARTLVMGLRLRDDHRRRHPQRVHAAHAVVLRRRREAQRRRRDALARPTTARARCPSAASPRRTSRPSMTRSPSNPAPA